MSKIIYTSCYNRILKYPDLKRIAISRSTPKYLTVDRVLLDLAPNWDLINYWKQEKYIEGYTHRYYEEVLNKVDLEGIFNTIEEDSAILCHCTGGGSPSYENNLLDPAFFCHRFLVAKEATQNLGITFIEI